jgi:hypothetical protein
MQFALLIYDNEQRWASGYDPAELARYREFGKEFAPVIKGGNALLPTATASTVRVRDGKPAITDGPFAETKEQFAGFYLVDVKDAEEAKAVAAKIPAASSGAIEVRPVMVFSS